MSDKTLLKNWSESRLQEELVLTCNRIENLNFCSVNDIRFQAALSGELNRRAILRKTTPTERHNMNLRQINVVTI